MQQVNRQQIFAQAAKKLRSDFDALSPIPHAGLKGHEAEHIVREFLKGHLPKRFDVGSGFVIDPNDQLSRQTDLIIYDALNCPVYRASETAAIIPSDNVAAVVEVKSRLDKDSMRDAFEKIGAVKGLSKTKSPDVPFLVTTQTFGCLFAFTNSISMKKLTEHYTEFCKSFGLGRHIDVVLVLDKGIIMLAGRMPTIPGWAPLLLEGFGGKAGEGAHIAVANIACSEDSLDMFLRFLLGQLIHFRPFVGHPGFEWMKDGAPGQMAVTYLTSVTTEQDPVLRAEKLQRYAEEVRAEFGQPQASKATPHDAGAPKSEAPAVIHLPDRSKDIEGSP
jgi:hypothetical protein